MNLSFKKMNLKEFIRLTIIASTHSCNNYV